MLIDWCDTLHFEVRVDGQISRSDLNPSTSAPDESLPNEDLTVRAARALQLACSTSLGVHITLQKNIPCQAGMGGGSSDAASCLLALQRLWGVQLPLPKLQAIALSLGADVPFFLSGGHAWVEGIGEKITPLALPPATFLVIKPPAGVSTPSIFSDSELKRDSKTATIQGFAESDSKQIFRFGHNDLQPVAQKLCPQIGQSLRWLEMQDLQGRMTGSGSAVFAHLPDNFKALVPFDSWTVRKCKNLETHPLVNW